MKFHVINSTPFQNPKVFMGNNETKDALTLYLAEKAFEINKPLVTVTHIDVKSNIDGYNPSTKVSSQMEADTLMILHALELSAEGKIVHFLTQDTDVFVLVLRRYPLLSPMTAVITGTGEKQRTVF